MKTKLRVLTFLGVIFALVQVYRFANYRGYSEGWSDAQCGIGISCEAGQE